MCKSGGKFLQPWQMTDNIIEGIFFPIHIPPFFQMTQTQKNITCRASKIHECIQGNVYEWGKVS